MAKQERLSNLLQLVIEHGTLEVDTAANLLDVSEATIRRDFDTLAQRNLLNRSHGAATAIGSSIALPLTYKVAKEDETKQKIAQCSTEYVKPHEVIAFNGGTTATACARAIAVKEDITKVSPNDFPAITVVTNAVNIAAELTVRNYIRIMVTGGIARTNSFELTGTFAENSLNQISIDTTFLGIQALDLDLGAMSLHEDEALVNRKLAERSKQVILVSDSSKFNKRLFAVICELDKIDKIITDSNIDKKFRQSIEQKGIEVVIA